MLFANYQVLNKIWTDGHKGIDSRDNVNLSSLCVKFKFKINNDQLAEILLLREHKNSKVPIRLKLIQTDWLICYRAQS